MIPGIEEKRLVNGVLQNGWPSYATLHQASVSLQDMGDRVITTQARIDGDVVPDFSGWELYFKGERFVLPSDNPQASKDNSSRNSIVDLQFQSWVIQELKRYYFFEAASVSAGVAIADKYVAPVRLDVEGFMGMLNQVLNYYFGGKIVADLYMSGQGIYSQEPKVIDINYSYLWDVIGQIFEIYGVRNRIEYNSTTGVYTIKFGYPAPAITDHDFEYGYKGGLLKFERQVQDETITNILLGRGGEKNLPYRYFKLKEENAGTTWEGDPDAIPELANIYFDRLRDANFRWYVRGWMHNPNRDTSGDDAWDPGHVFPTYEISQDSPYYWAYQKGLTDEQFSPVEYVKDDASIEAYGERWGAADDNDEIYPTIQGRSRNPIGRIDEVVAVSEIITDDIAASAAEAIIEKSINPMLVTRPSSNPYEILTDWFEIPTGQTGNISSAWVGPTEGDSVTHIDTTQSTLVALDSNGTAHPISGLSAGQYRLRLTLKLYVPDGHTTAGTWGLENIKLTTSAQDANAWKPTFDIWVKNIWNTTKGSGESDEQYAARVWEKILGDRVGNEAKVVFSTGFMSVSEDYEFVIASYPVYDTSKNINGVPSEWRITLRKSDAEYDATGLFIPNASTGGKPIAGDKFFFTGIDMPFLYVTLGEEDLNTNKSSQLDGLSVVNPTWVISLDKVRVHTLEDGEYGQTLAERLAAGAKLNITDPRFSGGDVLTLYAQSITYTWNEPSENSPYIVPDIEVVLSDKVVSRQSRTDKMESSIEEIKATYARLDDVERVVRSVAEPLFLKKTGEADSSDSPTQFASKVTSKGFRQGGVGGNGWGFYSDNTEEVAEGEEGDGDTVLEVDRVVVRKELHVNSLVANQTVYRGGREVQSAAKIECTKVVVDDSGKYVCYFDQKQGSVKNLFIVGDFAYSTDFAPDNTVVKYYRRRVDAVDVDRIVLSDTVKDGAGVPAAGDVIIQYGHESNAARQFVIVRDVIGGGYERMISGLSTVSAAGEEYYFAGRQAGQYYDKARWFVGSASGEYAEYLNGQLNIKGRLQVLGESGDYSDLGYLADALPKKGATLVQGGLILTSMIQLGQVENSAFKVYSGINGKVDEALADPTKTIAAWYGGEMLEKSAWDAMSAADKLVHQYAKTVYRFDGSGYLAGGNIHWDENGYGGIPGITWSRPSGSQNDVITIGSNVILEAGQGADQSVASMVSAVNSLQQILDWFEEVNLGTDQNPAWAVRLKKKTVGSSQLNRAFITYGDQIVGIGTPGGGGSAGKSYLHELLDVYGNPGNVKRYDGTDRQSGDLLGYNSTLDKWVAIAQSAITPDMSNYYTKAQTYSQAEVNALIGAIDQFHYEIAASTSAVTDPKSNVLYLIGPTGSGADKYEEYVYTNSTWTKIGDTSIDLSGYVQTSRLEADEAILSDAIQSLQSQIDAVSARNNFDELTATSFYADMMAATYAYADRYYLTNGLYFYVDIVDGVACVHLNAPFITDGDQILGDGTPGGGGGTGATYLWQLGDVDVPSVAGQIIDGQALVWDAASSKWKNRNITQGTVTRVDVGSTQYSPENGVVSLPAYPTKLPASDVYAWAKAYTKPSYSLTEISGTADLQAIEALSGTSGLLRKTAANTWQLDTNSYVTSSGVTSITAGTGLSGGTITGTGTIAISSTYQDYIAHGESAYNKLSTVSTMLQSLQSQIDAVASRDMFDELAASAFSASVAAVSELRAGYAYAERYYLTDDVYFTADIVDGVVCVKLNSPLITTGDQILGSGGPSGGGGGGDISYLYELADVDDNLNAPASGTILQWYSNKWIGTAFTSIASGDLLTYASGKWTNVARTSVGIVTDATTSTHGLMSAADKTKLDGINTTYISNGQTAYENLSTVSAMLQSLQKQVDSVASRDMYEELCATDFYSDVAGIGSLIADNIELGGESLKSIPNSYLANHSISINGSTVNLGGSFSTASITAGTAGTSSATSGASISIPYVTMNAYGIVTAYGTHTHSVSLANLVGGSAVGSASLPVYYNGSALAACTGSSLFSAMSSGASTNLSVTVAGQTRTATLYATYDSASENISDKFGIVSGALQSLQKQIDSVASRSDISDFEATTEAKLDYVCDLMRSLQSQIDSVASRTADVSANGYFDVISVGRAIYGDVLITSGDQTLSDERRKTITREITLTAEQIASCRAVAFDWKDKPGSSFGSIAQDWQKILPESVNDVDDTLYHFYGQSAEVAVINLAREVVELKKIIRRLTS